jgi:hypothetical protein
MEENLNVKIDNMKTIKVIGTIMWILSAFTLGMALFVDYIQGFRGNADAFHILVCISGLVFIIVSPIYLNMVYSNTIYLSEKEIQRLKRQLQEKIEEYNTAAVGYSQATKKCFVDVQDLKDYLNIKSKDERVKEVDDLFNNVPLDYPTQLIREKVLTYIRENG